MATLTIVLGNLRNRLEETSARFWSDSELTDYLNEGVRVVARRTETLQDFVTNIAAVVGTQLYSLPANCLRVHRVEWSPTGDTLRYPMRASTDDEMDNIWGINQLQQSSNPRFYTIWGVPGLSGPTSSLQLKIYPTPAQTGNFRVFYYRLPLVLVNGTDVVEVVAGYEDLAIQYAYSVALMKDRDDRWKDARQMFEEDITYLIDVSRQWHDQQRNVQMSPGIFTPAWLYSFEDV